MTHQLTDDLSEAQAEALCRIVKHRAKDLSKVWLSRHALEQSWRRMIYEDWIADTLRKGKLCNMRARLTDGRAVIKLSYQPPGERVCAVVAALSEEGEDMVEIITVMWRNWQD